MPSHTDNILFGLSTEDSAPGVICTVESTDLKTISEALLQVFAEYAAVDSRFKFTTIRVERTIDTAAAQLIFPDESACPACVLLSLGQYNGGVVVVENEECKVEKLNILGHLCLVNLRDTHLRSEMNFINGTTHRWLLIYTNTKITQR